MIALRSCGVHDQSQGDCLLNETTRPFFRTQPFGLGWTQGGRGMTAKSILLVEDSASDIYLTQRAVAECNRNIQLWTMRDGPEALTFLRKDYPLTHVPTPVLIILDLRLPKMSGAQILCEIRQLPAYQATPIVMLSGTPKEQ